MKKLLLGGLILTSLSQAMAQKGFEIGFAGQVQSSWLLNKQDLDADNSLDYKLTLGSAWGLNLGYNFTNTLGIRSGLTYSLQGQRYKGAFAGLWSYEAFQRLDYIKIPVLFKYNSNPNNKTIFLLNIGPEFGFLAKSKSIVNFTYDDGTTSNVDDENKLLYSKLDIAAVVGIGFQFNLSSNTNLNIMLRTAYSLTDAEDKDAKNSNGVPYYNSSRSSNNNLVAGLNIGFNYIIKQD